MIKNNRGISIVEVLIVMGLVALVASLSAGFVASQRKQATLNRLNGIFDSYTSTARSVLSLSSACTALLPKAGQYALASGVVDLVQVNGQDKFNKAIYDDIFYVSAAVLRYRTLSLDQASNSYTDATYISGNEREIIANLELEIKLRPDFMTAVAGFDSVRASKVVIPIKMFDEKSASSSPRRWSGVVCSAEDSEEAIFKAQICNLYGGSLTDGSYCDFTRVVRNNLQDAVHPPSKTQVQKTTQTNTNRVQRVRLSEIVCYIDSLMILTRDLPSVPSSHQKRQTTYCRHPGGDQWSTVSRDATKFFAN